jgi:REP element-mobilizing transposase RayT
MPRKPRIELGGALYHIMSRGNDRRKIFRTKADYLRFAQILAEQKAKFPFFLYAYCLMPNHFHLLIEMRDHSISRIMQRLLTGYSQYHNRKYKRTGHLFQGRYKSILCQTDQYLAELVRYIHLNPVRAKMVKVAEQYEHSGHLAYIGTDRQGLIDSEPVLRHFGGTRRRAVEVYQRFVEAGLSQKRQVEYYRAAEGRFLGNVEFQEEIKHRIGEHQPAQLDSRPISIDELLSAAEEISGFKREDWCAGSRRRKMVAIREAVIGVGQERGIRLRDLASALGTDPSSVTRRLEAVRSKGDQNPEIAALRRALGIAKR